jgi:low temperature requirement protein LtrA
VTHEDSRKVSTLELFFDLVFVFALTQVTLGLSAKPTWSGLAEGFVLFVLLWWAWGAFAWLTTVLRLATRGPRVVVLLAMAAMLLVAFAVPKAYGDGAVLFAVGWTVVMLLHALLFHLATEADSTAKSAVAQIGGENLLAGAILIAAAAFTDGTLTRVLFVVAALVAYATPYIWGVRGFSISAAHFAERHGLIMIVALGESIVATGAGAGDLEFDLLTIGTILCALILVSALYWAYFDTHAEELEGRLQEADGPARASLARDVYSYLHIPLVFGIVLAALGLKKTLGHADEPLKAVTVAALAGGIALCFAALVAMRFRSRLRVTWLYAVGPVGCVLVALALRGADAVVVLAVVAVIAVVAAQAAQVPRLRTAGQPPKP